MTGVEYLEERLHLQRQAVEHHPAGRTEFLNGLLYGYESAIADLRRAEAEQAAEVAAVR